LNFFIDNWTLFLVAFTSGAFLLWPVLKRSSAAGSVGAAEAVRLINREKAVLVDVGDATEFAAGHAGGARHIPLATLEGNKALPSNKSLPIVVLCPTGARAAKAANQLRQAGWEKAVALSGGTAAWREASLPVEKVPA
jgi:rhodanese-related sulfurtransferase